LNQWNFFFGKKRNPKRVQNIDGLSKVGQVVAF